MEDSRKMRVAVYCRLATKQQNTPNAQAEMMHFLKVKGE